jgi:glycosidase
MGPWKSGSWAILGAALLGPAAGCMQFDEGLEGEIALKTHVSDWRDEIVYQVLIDRFANGDPGNDFRVDRSAMGKWHGGDWKGLEDNLDYLDELGVTTLWISPVVKNVDTDAGFDGYHGYWAQDLTATNPHFGDLPALRSLVRSAHDRKMKVILDIVTNHLSQLFYYDIDKNGEPNERLYGNGVTSPFEHINEYDPDFEPTGVVQSRTSLGYSGPAPVVFVYDPASNHVPPEPALFQDYRVYNRRGRTINYDDKDQLLHGDFPGGLKDVNTRCCEVRESMVDVYARWVELADLDGFRIDTVKHVDSGFWRYFTQKMRKRLAAQGKKNFLMFGEVFDGNDALLGSFTKNDLPVVDEDAPQQCLPDSACEDESGLSGDQLDSVFYFSQHFQAIRDVFQSAQSTDRIQSLWDQKPTNFGTVPTEGGTGLPPHKALVNFLDNHDVPRFLFGCGSDPSCYARPTVPQLHNALLFLLTVEGIPCVYYGTEQELAGGNDPDNREDMWETGYATDGATFRWLQRLTRLRRGYVALRRGDQKVVWSTGHTGDEADAGVFAFERAGGDAGDQYALVVFNTNRDHDSTTADGGTTMTTSLTAGTVLRDVLHGSTQAFTVGDGGALTLTIAPTSGAVLVPEGQVVSGL